MINQNGYGPLQLCIECKKPLEKARVHFIGRGKCNKCKYKKVRERLDKLKDK